MENIHRPCHCTVQWRTYTGPAIVLSNGEHSQALPLYCPMENIHRPCHCTVQWRTFTGPAIVLSNGEHSHALPLYCLVVCCHSQALSLYCLIVCCYSFCDSVRSIWVEAIYLCMIIPLDMDTEQYWWYPRDLSIYDNPIRHWYRTVLVIPSGFIYIW